MQCHKGKMCAQVAHASMAAILLDKEEFGLEKTNGEKLGEFITIMLDEELKQWLDKSFKKIVLYVNSEKELDEIYEKAEKAGLRKAMIEDNGTTEFRGVKTKTCIAIGPHDNDKFIGVTDNLPLY